MSKTSEIIGHFIERIFGLGFAIDRYAYLSYPDSEDSIILKIIRDKNQNLEEFEIFRKDGDLKHPKELDKFILKFKKLRTLENNLINSLNKNIEILDGISLKELVPNQYIIPPISPMDMYALTSQLLKRSGAYHHIEAATEPFMPLEGEKKRILFIKQTDREKWLKIAQKWHDVGDIYDFLTRANNREGSWASLICSYWIKLLKYWKKPIYNQIGETEECPPWWKYAFALMVIADEAAKDVGFKFVPDIEGDSPKETISIWASITQNIINAVIHIGKEKEHNKKYTSYVETISFANPNIVSILPKSKTAQLGCTLRSFSINLAAISGRGSIRVGWAWAQGQHKTVKDNPVFNMLLIPYPYVVHSTNFKPTTKSDNSKNRWGHFSLEVVPNEEEDSKFIEFVSHLIWESEKQVGSIHAIVLPEMALSKASVNRLKRICKEDHKSIELLCTGIRQHPDPIKDSMKINGAYMATFNLDGEKHELKHECFHEKNHRWRLDEQQIIDYDLSPTLDPSRVWWEDIRIINRKLPFMVMRDRWSVTTLICEDLARNEPIKPVVEAIGPNLVIALLMDGPQIKQRWPARYANVLSIDPGSSVLSFSSQGLISRSSKVLKERGEKPSKSFALWTDDKQTKSIGLKKGSHGVVLSLTEYPKVDYTMDGRIDDRSISLRLTGQRQVRHPTYKGFPTWDKP